MNTNYINQHLDELAQCVSDALDIKQALHPTPTELIRIHPQLEFIVESLYELAHWLEPILEDDEDDDEDDDEKLNE